MKRAGIGFLSACLVAFGLGAGAAPASAATTAVAATGNIQCTVSGKVAFKPAERFNRAVKSVSLKAVLSNCTAANEGPIAGGTLSATIGVQSIVGIPCPVSLAPFAGATALHVKWKTASPAPRLLASDAVVFSTNRLVDPVTNALGADVAATTGSTGSVANSTVHLNVHFDVTDNAVSSLCFGDKGISSLPFTGVNGASTLSVEYAGPPACEGNFTVDAVHGNDSNAGDCHAPFKTITKALSVAGIEYTIIVKPGTYDSANGEVFPLVLRDEELQATAGTTTKIVGDVHLTSTAAGPGSLFNLQVVGHVQSDGGSLDGTSVTNPNGDCITSTGLSVSFSTVHDCAGVGVHATSGFLSAIGSAFTHSAVNVQLDAGVSAGLNGFPPGWPQPHPNTFSCGTTADIVTSVDVDAANNLWDHAPPTFSTLVAPSGGVDVSMPILVGVTYTNAAVAPNNCH